MSEEDLPEVRLWVVYRWDCECGWINYREIQPSIGDTDECDGCDRPSLIGPDAM